MHGSSKWVYKGERSGKHVCVLWGAGGAYIQLWRQYPHTEGESPLDEQLQTRKMSGQLRCAVQSQSLDIIFAINLQESWVIILCWLQGNMGLLKWFLPQVGTILGSIWVSHMGRAQQLSWESLGAEAAGTLGRIHLLPLGSMTRHCWPRNTTLYLDSIKEKPIIFQLCIFKVPFYLWKYKSISYIFLPNFVL